MDSGKKCTVVEVPGLQGSGPEPFVPGAEFILSAVADRSMVQQKKQTSENVGNKRPRQLFTVTYNNRKGNYIERVPSSALNGRDQLLYTTGQTWQMMSSWP